MTKPSKTPVKPGKTSTKSPAGKAPVAKPAAKPSKKPAKPVTDDDGEETVSKGTLTTVLSGIANLLKKKPQDMEPVELLEAFCDKATRTRGLVDCARAIFGDSPCIVINRNGLPNKSKTLARYNEESKRRVYGGLEVVSIEVALGKITTRSPYDYRMELDNEGIDEDGIAMPESSEVRVFIRFMVNQRMMGLSDGQVDPQRRDAVNQAVENYPEVPRSYEQAKILFEGARDRNTPEYRKAVEDLTAVTTQFSGSSQSGHGHNTGYGFSNTGYGQNGGYAGDRPLGQYSDGPRSPRRDFGRD